MDSDLPENAFDHLQDVLGTLPALRTYIVTCVCFSTTAITTSSGPENILNAALQSLATSFPFLAADVVIRAAPGRNYGTPHIVPSRKTIQLLMNDLRLVDCGMPSTAELAAAKYPFSMLDAASLVPPKALSWNPEESDTATPVLILQANMIKGRLATYFCWEPHDYGYDGARPYHHSVCQSMPRRTFHRPRDCAGQPVSATCRGPCWEMTISRGQSSIMSCYQPLDCHRPFHSRRLCH